MLVRRLPGQRGSVAAAKATSPSIKMFTKTTGVFRMANMAREGPPHGQKRPSGPPWPHVVNVAREGHRASGHVNFAKPPMPRHRAACTSGTRIPDGQMMPRSPTEKQLCNHKDVYDSGTRKPGYGLTPVAEFVTFWTWANEAPIKPLRSMGRKGVADG